MPASHSLPDTESRPAADAAADARGAQRGPAELRLNLGCGGKRLDGFVGVDRYPTPAVDVLADLGATLPFAPGSPPTVDGEDVLVTDIVGTNGVVHAVGGVLLPPS